MFRQYPSCSLVCARPPSDRDCSNKQTALPFRARNVATAKPATPPPITATSIWFPFDCIVVLLSDENTFERTERLQRKYWLFLEQAGPKTSFGGVWILLRFIANVRVGVL